MYIDFDEYPPYSAAISETFETSINAHTQWDCGYPYSTNKGKMFTRINEESWEMMETFFPDANQVMKFPQQQYAKYLQMFRIK